MGRTESSCEKLEPISAFKAIVMIVITLSLFLGACSTSSVLINSDDRTFKDSQVCLLRTNRLVAASEAAPSEKSLFLQAEAFYRYRF